MTRLGIWKSGEALRIFWVPPRSGECGVKSEKNAPESKSLQKQSRKKMKTQSGMSKNCLAKICARLPEDPSSSLLQSVPGLEITSTHVHSRILIGRNDSEKKNYTKIWFIRRMKYVTSRGTCEEIVINTMTSKLWKPFFSCSCGVP